MLDLLRSADHEIAGVMIGGTLGPSGNIDLFMWSAACDPVVLYACEFSRSIRWQKRPQIVQIQIMTYVAIEVAISRVTGISFLCAPDLFARFTVPTKNRRTRGRKAWRVDSVARARITEHQTVRVE